MPCGIIISHGTFLDCSRRELKVILTLDLGNTNLYIGVCDDEKVVETYRTSTDTHKSGDEYALVLKSLLIEHIQKEDIDGVICSSVVPSLNSAIRLAIKRLFNKETLFVKAGLKTGLSIKIDNPNELGADLVCDGVGALHKYGKGVAIVDLGTASKIIVIDKNGAFAGGTISAGLKISMEALAGKTANLSETSLETPKCVVGRNTTDCINAGTIIGHKVMIEGLIKQMEEELGYSLTKVITGGFAAVLNNLKGFIYDDHLVLDGLRIIYLKNRGEQNEW